MSKYVYIPGATVPCTGGSAPEGEDEPNSEASAALLPRVAFTILGAGEFSRSILGASGSRAG
jgi:hypothetical protein